MPTSAAIRASPSPDPQTPTPFGGARSSADRATRDASRRRSSWPVDGCGRLSVGRQVTMNGDAHARACFDKRACSASDDLRVEGLICRSGFIASFFDASWRYNETLLTCGQLPTTGERACLTSTPPSGLLRQKPLASASKRASQHFLEAVTCCRQPTRTRPTNTT